MIDEANYLLSAAILLLGCGMWPVAFLFAGCAPCCDDACPWGINLTRCLRFTVVGSDPPSGGDCLTFPTRRNPGLDLGELETNHLRLYNRPKDVTFSISVLIGNSSFALPAVGETVNQVWQLSFLPPGPGSDVDVFTPPWIMQINLSVNGVATEEEEGASHTFGEDEYGQPKLFVTVNQRANPIEFTSPPVSISLVGTQRFIYAIGRIEGPFRTGWSVSFSNYLVLTKSPLILFTTNSCPGRVQDLYLTEENSCSAFLRGETAVRLHGENGEDYDLQLSEPNALCGRIPNVSEGATLGVYPRFIRTTAPELGTSDLLWSGAVSRSLFFSGRSLLFDLENGPYRESAAATVNNVNFEPVNVIYELTDETYQPPRESAYFPANLPAEGGEIFFNLDNPISLGNVIRNRSRFPRLLFDGQVEQAGSCVLKGVAEMGRIGVGGDSRFKIENPASLQSLGSRVLAGSCYYLLPLFGPVVDSFRRDGDTYSANDFSQVPCSDCEVLVTQASGEENASVELLTEGDKSGFIELKIKRDWLPGMGVTLVIQCGNDTFTQTVREPIARPFAPLNFMVTRGPCSRALLSWEVPSNDGGSPITSYVIQYRVINTGSYQTYATVPAASLSASVFNLLRLGYDFRVAAINALGTGAYATVTDGFALDAPTSLAFTRSPPECDAVTLAWTPPAQSECVVVASYRIEYRNPAATSTYTLGATVAGTATSGSISGLPTNVRLEFRVGRVDDANTTLYSGTVISGNFPFTPTAVTATLGEAAGIVNLTWTAQETACFEHTDYNVQFRPSTTSTFSDFARSPSTAKSATVTGLTPGVTYFFRVRAVNAIGTSSFSSSSGSIAIPE
jgi:hypothetical protein